MDQIARRTYKVKNFNGDNYLSREEVNTFIKPKITKKLDTKKPPPPHVKKKVQVHKFHIKIIYLIRYLGVG